MELSSEIFGVIVGGILGIVSGVVVTYFTICFGEKRTKQSTSRALLPEIEVNQDRLQLLVDIKNAFEEAVEERVEANREEWHDIKIPNEMSFDRTIYSALSSGIGVLDTKSRENVVTYFVKIKRIEEQHKMLPEIHGLSASELKNERTDSDLEKRTGGTPKISIRKWDEVNEYFTKTEETYNIGKELIKSLK
ncbi:MAG: hypothetical protein SVO01_02625 [Thermotogota bacterium]|nr:hypothetical protein [Thermotogota bacterium]